MNARQRKKWRNLPCDHFQDHSCYYHGSCDEEYSIFCKMKQSESYCNCEECRHFTVSQCYRHWSRIIDKENKRHPYKCKDFDIEMDKLLEDM